MDKASTAGKSGASATPWVGPSGNRLLDALSPNERTRVMEHAVLVDLPMRHTLYESGEIPAHAFFPTAGVASIVASVAGGSSAEVGMFGDEGVGGALQLLGPARVPSRCFMQVAGAGWRLPYKLFVELYDRLPGFRAYLLQFVQVQAMSSEQVSGCHRLHTSQQRLSRWLLMASDRVQSQDLQLTQEFLAEMLATQRPTVSSVAARLQQLGAIRYHRGHIHVLSRQDLEKQACCCYAIVRDLAAGLYRTSPADPQPGQ